MEGLTAKLGRTPNTKPCDLIVEVCPGTDHEPWAIARATWVLTGLEAPIGVAQVVEVIDTCPWPQDMAVSLKTRASMVNAPPFWKGVSI